MRSNPVNISLAALLAAAAAASLWYFAGNSAGPAHLGSGTSGEQLSVPQPSAGHPPGEKQESGGRIAGGETDVDISVAAIKSCLSKPMGESGTCLDLLFREFFETSATADALAAIRQYEATDSQLRLSCHPVVHAIGRETFRLKSTVQDSFAACDQTCHSGCYHGAMERFMRGEGGDEERHISFEEVKAKAATACDPNQPTRFRFQCLHGLGHAVVYFADYQLEQALEACDAVGDGWSRSSCYGGAFMENVFSATPEKSDLSSTDYHYPCSKLGAKYQNDCYMMQTTRMSEMGLSTDRLFEECRAAGQYRHTCMQSIGRDLSNDVRIGDPALVAKKCERGAPGPEREACTRGVAYALIDNTWDGKYAFPFCQSYDGGDDAAYCFTISTGYLRGTFEKSAPALIAECNQYAPLSAPCRAAAGN